MRLNKEYLHETDGLTEDVVKKAIKMSSGIRCTKEDFEQIVDFIDSHNSYQFLVESSHKDGFDFYVRFGYINTEQNKKEESRG